MKKSNVLVTGGCGFIGTHLCRVLTQLGHSVRVLDIKEPKVPNLEVQYIRGDILDDKALALAMLNIDFVYHFAAIVSVPLCQENPVGSYATNFMGTCKVLEGVRLQNLHRKNPIRVLFAGSSAVYGNSVQSGKAIREGQTLPEPASFYGAQKLSSEQVMRLYHSSFGISVINFRFFNVYGPGQDPGSPYSGVIAIFSSKISNGGVLSLHGGGIQTRDFISVHDLAVACANGLETDEINCNGQPINLGSGASISIASLGRLMMEIAGTEVKTSNSLPREGDVLHSLADISRAQDILAWKPKVSLKEGLTELHAYLRLPKAA